MQDLLKWVEAQAAPVKAVMDAHEAVLAEQRAKGTDADHRMMADVAGALLFAGARYEVWMAVLHKVASIATFAGADEALRLENARLKQHIAELENELALEHGMVGG